MAQIIILYSAVFCARLLDFLPLDSGSGILPLDSGSGILPLDSGSGILPLESGSGILPLESGSGILPLESGSGILPLNWMANSDLAQALQQSGTAYLGRQTPIWRKQ